jgi:hypothetical protein
MEKFKMIRKTNRETLLEKRITRLENMIKNERRTRKFENVGMLGRDLERALKAILDTDWYNIKVSRNRDGSVSADIWDNDNSEWSIGGSFKVTPDDVELGDFAVDCVDGAGKLIYNVGNARSLVKAAKMIADCIHEDEADM